MKRYFIEFLAFLRSLWPFQSGGFMPQIIHSISFKDAHGTDFVFTVGDEFIINESTKGTIERISVRDAVVTTETDSFIVKHTMHLGASFVLKAVDEHAQLKLTLRKLVKAAKEKQIVSPILANQLIEELQPEGK